MATDNLNHPPRVAFQPYVFSMPAVNRVKLPGAVFMSFVNRTHDIACGAMTLIDMLECDDLNVTLADGDEKPLLTSADKSNVRRMLSATFQMMAEHCDETRKWAYEAHTPEGRKAAVEAAARSAAKGHN